jgi:hypothetical protein
MTPYAEPAHKLAAELSPTAFDVYLTAKGYERVVTFPNFYCVYRRPEEPLNSAIEVPINPGLIDYGRRMYEAVEKLDGAFLGLLYAIDPRRFPRERVLALAGVTP